MRCKDETPLVRCVASVRLADFARVVEGSYLKSEIIEMFEVLARDEQVVRNVHPSCVRI